MVHVATYKEGATEAGYYEGAIPETHKVCIPNLPLNISMESAHRSRSTRTGGNRSRSSKSLPRVVRPSVRFYTTLWAESMYEKAHRESLDRRSVPRLLSQRPRYSSRTLSRAQQKPRRSTRRSRQPSSPSAHLDRMVQSGQPHPDPPVNPR